VRRRILAWLPVVVWAAVIFALSSIPGTKLPRVDVPMADKIAHLCVYAVLGALGFRAVRLTAPAWSSPPAVAAAVAIATVYGASDELHQLWTPNRTPDWQDAAADALGGAFGALVALTAARGQGRRRARRRGR
jgi:VanZ family protein